MSQKLKDKVALVTGGSRGIGAAIAKKLAEEGAHVAISYHSSPDKAQEVINEIIKNGVKAKAFKADQANVLQAQELVEGVVKHFGQLDILVNNAGVYTGAEVSDPTFDMDAVIKLLETNVIGVVATVKEAIKFMREGGRIITIGSVNGERVPFRGQADYSATKACLIGYTKGWARDLGSKNITVNIVQPGPIDTDMNPEDTDFANSVKPLLAIKRYGKPEEVAAAVVFLASPEASYITSSILNVDGGFNA